MLLTIISVAIDKYENETSLHKTVPNSHNARYKYMQNLFVLRYDSYNMRCFCNFSTQNACFLAYCEMLLADIQYFAGEANLNFTVTTTIHNNNNNTNNMLPGPGLPLICGYFARRHFIYHVHSASASASSSATQALTLKTF